MSLHYLVKYKCQKTGDSLKHILWSQGSVATYSSFGRMTNFLQICCWVCWWKDFKNQWTFGKVTGKKVDCLKRSVRLGTVPLKGEEFARRLEYGEKQLLLTVVTSISTLFSGTLNPAQSNPIYLDKLLSKWCVPILTCRLTPSIN